MYLILVVITAQFYQNPPQGWRPAGWEPRSAVSKAATTYDFTVKEAMGTWQFWLLWVMLFLNVSAGIMIISQASPMAQQLVGLTPVAAAGIVGVISIFNGLGRVFWAAVSDFLGRARVYFLLYLIQVVVFFSLPHLHTAALFTTAVASSDSVMAAVSAPCRRLRQISSVAKFMGGIYGWILLAWGAGAIPSPILIARVRQTTGQYTTAIHVIAIVMLCSLALPLIARRPKRELEKPIGVPEQKAA